MIDERVLAWTCLLPHEPTISAWHIPPAVQTSLHDRQGGAAVWFGWQPTLHDLPLLGGIETVALANPRGIRPSALRAAGLTHVRMFAVLPSLDEPRWFLPLQSRRAAVRAWDLYTPFRGGAIISKLLAKAITAGGGLGAVGDRFVLASREASPLERTLQDVLHTPSLDLAIATGTPGTRRKITLQATTPCGEVVGYAKVAAQPHAVALVRNEARVRAMLAERPFRDVVVPRVLYHGACQGGTMVVSEPTKVAHVRPVLTLTERHHDVLLAMAAWQGEATTGELVARLRQRAEGLPLPANSRWQERFERGLVLLAHIPLFFELPTAFAHGDFTPWNIQIDQRSGRIAIVDWEDARYEQFLLWDAFHFTTQTALLLGRGVTERRITDFLDDMVHGRVARTLGLGRATLYALYLAYLLDWSVQWFEEPQPQSVQDVRGNVIDLTIALCTPHATLPVGQTVDAHTYIAHRSAAYGHPARDHTTVSVGDWSLAKHRQ